MIVILGPTASGKTNLAIRAANHYKTEIISADSRQFYKELNIGVARPSAEELAAVRHHFIAFLSIQEEYSAGRFEVEALKKADELYRHYNHVICAGGSTLYVQSFLNGLDELPSDKTIREALNAELISRGIEALAAELKQLDPEYASVADLQNPHRVIRALEVCRITGKKYSSLRIESDKPRPFTTMKFGIGMERAELYERINKRVDLMIEAGLEEECRALYPYRHLNALQTVGYTEFFEYFDGKQSRSEAIEKIKQHTRNYAKRQLTWWRRDPEIHWLKGNADVMLDQMMNFVDG